MELEVGQPRLICRSGPAGPICRTYWPTKIKSVSGCCLAVPSHCRVMAVPLNPGHCLGVLLRQSPLLLKGQKGFNVGMSRIKKAVIFDKDGTLIDVHSQWAPWIRHVVDDIESRTNLDISAEAFNRVGFDDKTERVLPGILGAGTGAMVSDCLSAVVHEVSGIPRGKTDSIVRASLQTRSSLRSEEVHPIGDVAGMFSRLREVGYQIAVNTSDSRDTTLQTLDHIGVLDMVDMVVCGDDDLMRPKPDPVSAETICARLGVLPEHTIMIGDSLCDMHLATNAKLGWSIGVLSGIEPREMLEPDADTLTQNVTEAVNLILAGLE